MCVADHTLTSVKFLPHLGFSVHIYKITGVDNEPSFQLCESCYAPTDLPVQVHTAHQDMCVCSLVLPLDCRRVGRPRGGRVPSHSTLA